MKFTKLLGLTAAAVFATSANANMFVLDDFQYSDGDVSIDTSIDAYNVDLNSDGVNDAISIFAGTNVVGASTTYLLSEVTNVNTNPNAGAAVNTWVNVGDGNLAFSNDAGVSAVTAIDYEFAGGGALPMTGWEGFYFDVTSLIGSFDLTLVVDYLGGGTATAGESYDMSEITNGQSNIVTVSFDSFVGSGIDWSQVVGTTAILSTTTPGSDFTVAEVGLIPEPAMLAVFGLGLVGLGMSRRRKA